MQAMLALRAAPAVSRAVLCVAAEQLAALGRLAASLRGTAEAVVVRPYAPPVRRDLTTWTDAGKGIAYVCFDASAETDSVDAGARASVDTLLADGVPTKTVAAVLAALTGWERRRAYDAVLRWPRPRD
jgi:hypothetical protein